MHNNAPLSHLRILELSSGKADMCGRLLADLGADVVLVEPPTGSPARNRPPLHAGQSLYFTVHNANKRSVQLDISDAEGSERLTSLAASADILIDTRPPSERTTAPVPLEALHQSAPQLIVISISDFGLTGPYSHYNASNAVHMALGGVLARSGIKGREPLLPPGQMAEEAGAIQAAWAVLLAVLKRNQDGLGNHLDFSLFEATAQLIDPGLGVTGSAAGGKTAAQLAERGRPPLSPFYPIFPCLDGHVRVCILNPRQWQGMSDWLGDDHPFTDPSYGNLRKRFSAIKDINTLISALFATRSGEELVVEGQQRGIPIAKLATPKEVFDDPHFQARSTFIELAVGGGEVGRLAAGYLELDGTRFGPRTPAPEAGSSSTDALWAARDTAPPPPPPPASYRPLEGLRVLDLGVIVAGAELGRLLSDQGAQVIKIENKAFPDGLRQSHAGEAITSSFAQGSRGKLSFGLNLRCAEGLALFKQLASCSDIVLSNFKPGTMESLGLGYETLKAINPGIIVADSSALGSRGPRSKSMGYGPLVRAATGLSGLWRYPDDPDSGFSDGITVYPDHFAARVSAVGIAALLLRRARTGEGGTVSVSQAECIVNAMATEFLEESLTPGTLVARGNRDPQDAPNAIFPCAGKDQWCAISVSSDSDFQAMCEVLERPDMAINERYATAAGRLQHAPALEAMVSEWTAGRTAREAMKTLQKAGVAAGKMQRVEELEKDPHLLNRLFMRRLIQPGISHALLTENGPVSFSLLPDPDIRPAPFLGQHTRALAHELLQLSDEQIDVYLRDGVLESSPATQ